MLEVFPVIQFYDGVCQGRALSRHIKEKIHKWKAWRASSPLDFIHSDFMGNFPHPSVSNAKYLLTFINDWSWDMWVYFCREKYELFENLKDFKAHIEKSPGR
jgi:hypothetical protein